MVTPESGVITFRGRNSGRLYGVSAYVSDVVAAKVTLNQNGAAVAGSDAYCQFQEPVDLVDMAFATGTTVMTGITCLSGGALIPGSAILYANVLNTLATRIVPKISWKAGSYIAFQQF